MFPGKKGFDRLVYASKNALSAPVTWLFCNISGTSTMLVLDCAPESTDISGSTDA